ncbi:MAG: permease prefix domain 2-containing transporter [Spirosomataceae bacterium]
MNRNHPPRWASLLLRWWSNPNTSEEVEGDLLELYNHWSQTVGRRKADWKYIFNVIKLLRPLAKRKNNYPSTYTYSPTMIRNYFKIAFRNLLKHKGYSFINIFGLATGMAVAMLIGLWVWDELSVNKAYQNYDRITKVMQNQNFNGEVQTWSGVPMQLAPELRTAYGNNFKYVVISGFPGQHLLSFGEKKIKQSGNYMDSEVTEMLSLKMVKGTRAGLQEPNSVLLSESVSKVIFGDADPMDKIIKIDNKQIVKVTGVYKDLPHNSSFHDLSFIAPWELMAKDLPKWLGWGNNWFQTYAQIADNTTPEKVSLKIKKAKQNNISQDQDKYKPEIFLLPMSQWHLYSEFKNGINTGGRIEFVWLFGIIGVFVLLLACINFMNLSTARSEKRAKEVGIRKAVGSVKGQLIMQFFGESLLVVIFAFTLSLLLVLLSLPFFNEVVDKKITVLWTNPFFWLVCLGFIFITGLIAGSYPALYLSSFKPIKVLKGTFKLGRFASAPRKVLVVVQFTVSVTLIIGTVVVFRQIQFAKDRPIGYNRNRLLTSSIKTEEIIKHYSTFRDDLLNTGALEELAATDR